MQLLVGFALVGSVLTLVGIYGVLSLSVAARRREIAIRAAIGAQQADIRNLVFAEGFRLIAGGVISGLAAAFVLSARAAIVPLRSGSRRPGHADRGGCAVRPAWRCWRAGSQRGARQRSIQLRHCGTTEVGSPDHSAAAACFDFGRRSLLQTLGVAPPCNSNPEDTGNAVGRILPSKGVHHRVERYGHQLSNRATAMLPVWGRFDCDALGAAVLRQIFPRHQRQESLGGAIQLLLSAMYDATGRTSSGARSGTATSLPCAISACMVRAGRMLTPRPSATRFLNHLNVVEVHDQAHHNALRAQESLKLLADGRDLHRIPRNPGR